ncbi:MAG: SpoIID/LytB domain-containing protein [Acidimicrobiia bacterium]|nr:SpoIID/LytB domain-containing protein [Acidimicrobiia bacterium]
MARTAVVALTIAALIVPAGTAAADEEATVTFEGAGWGHAVGLSQYGAYGASRDGWSDEEITNYFYQGTSIEVLGEGDLSVPDDIWVGLKRDLDSVTLIARQVIYPGSPVTPAPMTLTRPADGMSWELAVDDRVEINRVPGERKCDLIFSGSFAEESLGGSCDLDVTWDGDAEMPTRKIEVDGCEFIDWNGAESQYPPGGPSIMRPCQYGRGYLVIRAPGPPGSIATGPFDMSMVMGMEDYLLGISEMPYWWGHAQARGMEALKAQAIAARSYARELQLYRGTPGNNSCGAWCHVRDDTYDQRYVGWGHGWTTWTAAVESTAGEVMTHPDATTSPVAANDTENIVRGYYSSSSGGATEYGHEVGVGGTVPKPYYSSVPDPWSLDPSLNFRADWSFEFSADFVAGKVGLDTLESVAVTDRNTSGSARTVEFVGIDDGAAATRTWTSQDVRSVFGLYSIYFDVVYGTASPFTDIIGSVHYDDIVYIADAGITAGCNPPYNTEFCPGGFVTRGQMAAFLVRALGLSDDGGQDWFGDDDGITFEGDINRLATAGITFGCNEDGTRFCPNDTVSRAQMAAFLVRAFGYSDPGAGNWFTDDDGSIFESDIDKLRVAGVTFGCNPPDNDKYCPEDPVRRDQMASFLARALRGQA